jgi:HipA-like protein
MLRHYKIDKKDLFKQLITVGEDVVGSLTIKGVK